MTDVNEAPSTILDDNAAANTITENAAIGTLVGVTAKAVDSDTTDKVIYSLGDNAGGKFAINATTGVISVAGAIDYETSPTQNITVLATDISGLTTSETLTINVTNVNEAPTAISDSDAVANNIHMSAAIGTAVGITAQVADPDVEDTTTYSLTNNADGKFAIDAASGIVTVAGALDKPSATTSP